MRVFAVIDQNALHAHRLCGFDIVQRVADVEHEFGGNAELFEMAGRTVRFVPRKNVVVAAEVDEVFFQIVFGDNRSQIIVAISGKHGLADSVRMNGVDEFAGTFLQGAVEAVRFVIAHEFVTHGFESALFRRKSEAFVNIDYGKIKNTLIGRNIDGRFARRRQKAIQRFPAKP